MAEKEANTSSLSVNLCNVMPFVYETNTGSPIDFNWKNVLWVKDFGLWSKGQRCYRITLYNGNIIEYNKDNYVVREIPYEINVRCT